MRRWLPELQAVPDGHVQWPWTSLQGPPPGYPAPLVEHAIEREDALSRFAVVRAG